jgi:hypothetical protein
MILVSCWRKKGGEAAAAVVAAAAAAAILIVAAAKLEKSWKAAAAAAAAAAGEILVMAALLAELAVETWRTKSLILILEWVPLQQHLLLGEKAKLAGCSASLPLTLAFAPPTLCVLYS